MAQTAAHLVDHVLPHGVGYRQWVLTLPFDLRYRVAYDAELGRAILRAFVKTLSAWQLERAGESGIESAQWGAVTVVQRFGSALQLMPHFHTVGCDGAFSVDADGEAQVHTLSGPTSEDVERLVDEAWTQCPDARAVSKSPLCARFGGFDLHAGVSVAADDRYGLERLCRYLSRPALSHDRLEQLDEEHVGLQLKTPYSDGTTHLVLTFDELLQRLCALVPRPRTHRVRFHGILAPAAKHRAGVVPEPHSDLLPEAESTGAPVEHDETTTRGVHDAAEPETLDARDEHGKTTPRYVKVRRLLWAQLLLRVFGIDALKCPKCQGQMRVIATIIEAKVVKKILDSLGYTSESPAVRPARGPPDVELVEYTWY